MANIKSQIKRDKISAAAHADNSSKKNRARTAIKKVELLAKEGKKVEAEAALKEAVSLLDVLARENVISVNSANRKKAHLQGVVNAIA